MVNDYNVALYSISSRLLRKYFCKVKKKKKREREREKKEKKRKERGLRHFNIFWTFTIR